MRHFPRWTRSEVKCVCAMQESWNCSLSSVCRMSDFSPLIRNVDCVYGFRRYQNQISMMHIDKGSYLEMIAGEKEDGIEDTDAGTVSD